MKRETKISQGRSERDHPSVVRRALKNGPRWVVAAGLVIVLVPLYATPAMAGGANALGPDAPEARRPKAERHIELRKVLSAPREAGAGSDGRRKLSAEERTALRESMRGVYEPRESRDERGFNSRP